MFAPHAVPARDTLFRKRRVNRTSRPSEFPHSQIRGRSYITRPCVALREAGRRCLCHIPLTAPRLLQMRGQTSDRDPGTGEHSLIKSYLSHFALYEPRGLSSDSPARRAGTFQDGAEDGRRGGREPPDVSRATIRHLRRAGSGDRCLARLASTARASDHCVHPASPARPSSR